MKEIFGQLKNSLNVEAKTDLYEKLSEFKETLSQQFAEDFPELENDLFLKSKRWLEMVGTNQDERFVEEVPTEVEMWVTRELAKLIETM